MNQLYLRLRTDSRANQTITPTTPHLTSWNKTLRSIGSRVRIGKWQKREGRKSYTDKWESGHLPRRDLVWRFRGRLRIRIRGHGSRRQEVMWDQTTPLRTLTITTIPCWKILHQVKTRRHRFSRKGETCSTQAREVPLWQTPDNTSMPMERTQDWQTWLMKKRMKTLFLKTMMRKQVIS